MFKDKHKSPTVVQDLCKKLKDQLEQLQVEREVETRPQAVDLRHRKDLFESLRDQLAELSV